MKFKYVLTWTVYNYTVTFQNQSRKLKDKQVRQEEGEAPTLLGQVLPGKPALCRHDDTSLVLFSCVVP